LDAILQTLTLAQARLDEAGIRNVLIGGLAVAAWGRPRLTDDVDLKVGATRKDILRLIELLEPDFCAQTAVGSDDVVDGSQAAPLPSPTARC
jgi:hypothetical protein